MKICKNCGEFNPNDSTYCCKCGGTSFVIREDVVCPVCGALSDKSFVHCVNCGSALKQSVDEAQPTQQFAPTESQPMTVNLRDVVPDAYGGISVSPSETAICRNCGANVPLTAVYCAKCGSSVASLHEHRVVKRKVCPHCKRTNDSNARYCSYCYTSLDNAELQEMQVIHESMPLGNTMVVQAYLENASGKRKICPNCNAINLIDELFCVNCGLKLDVDEPKKYCPNCGSENLYDSSFCSKCRWQFNGTTNNAVSGWTCHHCNKSNSWESNFCTNCGTKKDQ